MQTIVHDAAFQWGGAERVVRELSKAAPSAPSIRFIAGDSEVLQGQQLRHHRVDVQYPGLTSGHAFRAATPLLALGLPRARPVDGQVTYSSYAVARWLPSSEPRFVYNHAPMRQIWHGSRMYSSGFSAQALALRATGPWLRAVDRRATSSTDFVVAPSERMARILRQTLGVQVRAVLPPPVDEDLFEHAISQDPADYFVWVGRVVEPIKNLSLLLELFSQRPLETLVIIGDGRDRQRLEASAPPNVRFVGWQHGAAKARLVADARALILPSIEDFGLGAAEALALGVPILVTPNAGISDWAGESSAIHVVAATAEGMGRGLDSVRDVERGNGVRGYAQKFSASIFRARVRDCWRELGWLT